MLVQAVLLDMARREMLMPACPLLCGVLAHFTLE